MTLMDGINLIFWAAFFAMGFYMGRRSIKDHEHD